MKANVAEPERPSLVDADKRRPAARASHRRRVLFVAETVTLAQCVRLVTLARALDPDRYEVHFASADFPDLVFAGAPFVQHRITTLAPEAAARALESGRRLYETPDVLRYIDAERRLIRALDPALVVGDFRLSLSTSAELESVPSAVLINAYWSPFARRTAFPVPDHPIVGVLGEALTARYFPRAIPHVFQHFARPINAARARHGLRPIGSLLEVLTHGSFTLYPDDPWLTPVDAAPSHHLFLGPVCWQPELGASESGGARDADSADLWPDVDPERPRIYVTLGSSGALRLLPMVVEALARLPVAAVIATAGRASLGALPAHLTARPFVRGAELARQAALVISNGGSTTGYQALVEGTPVLGLPSNFDQHLASQAIDRAGAGISLAARGAGVESIRESVRRALDDPQLARGARAMAERFARHDSASVFREFVDVVAGAERARVDVASR
ncbi:MAG TPA: nucleotide disphospho-sugar-binding domain-containing protein [Polyangiaceae bacterium]|nr:nucleotide disphospho-sugar-binding domain-containing protein [Polyangiaceae bacterium]